MNQPPKYSHKNQIYRFFLVILTLLVFTILVRDVILSVLAEVHDNQAFISPPELYRNPNKPYAHLILSITDDPADNSNIPKAHLIDLTTIWLLSGPPESLTCFNNLYVNSSERMLEEAIATAFQKYLNVPEGTNIPTKNFLPSYDSSYPLKSGTCFYYKNYGPMTGQLLEQTSVDISQTRSLAVNTVVSSYFYPYDEYLIEVSVALDGIQASSNEKPVTFTVYPNLTVFIDSQWPYDAKLIPNQDGTYDTIHITVHRSNVLGTLAILLFIITLVFIIQTIYVQETSSFLEISVGILFSLWTFQQLLVPENIVGTTIVHSAILFLYLTFAFASFIRFIIKPLWSKLGPIEAREVDNKQASTSEAKTEIFISNYKSSYSLNKRFVVIVTVLLTLIGLLRFKKAPKRK